ncbi:MAG TPA: GGDEF domain-containing protein [Candidatus Limnocylindrales bacterium]|nr:GGDEF domain-containing protein [Candidatus Limnocylindrales bacterium]
MDVLSLGLSQSTSFGVPDERGPLARLRRRLSARLLRLLDIRSTGGGAPDPGGRSAVVDTRRNLLLGYTAAEILLGLGLLVFVTIQVPLAPGIAYDALAGTALAGPAGGVLLWTMFGLMGSVRTMSSAEGGGHFTFHLPYVGAAMILGGPTAGAWVAFLSTIDRRELESQPWYGILANHTAMATAAVAGGAAYVLVHAGLVGTTGDVRLAEFVAVLVAGVVLEVVANAFAITTIKIRDGMSWAATLGIIVDEFRRETLLEIALIWVLVIAAGTVGWWAPLVVGVTLIWYQSRDGREDFDPFTGLARKKTFLARADRRIGWMRRGILPGGTMLYIDLNGFHLVNDEHGQQVGDVVLRIIADRLREVFPRQEDVLSRLMADEFAAFLAGMTDPDDATRKAKQLLQAICRPIPTPVGPVHVGAAIGLVVVRGAGMTPPSASTLLLRAEQAMYIAKAEGGPTGGWHTWSEDDRAPF